MIRTQLYSPAPAERGTGSRGYLAIMYASTSLRVTIPPSAPFARTSSAGFDFDSSFTTLSTVCAPSMIGNGGSITSLTGTSSSLPFSSAKALENGKLLDVPVSEVMEPPFPIIDGAQTVESVVKLLSKSNPALLVRANGALGGIVTRSDVLAY